MTHLLIWMLGYPVVAAAVMRLRRPIEKHTERTLRRTDQMHALVYGLGTAVFLALTLMP
jgi:ribosomal protein L25 (general stress protein Ctc)